MTETNSIGYLTRDILGQLFPGNPRAVRAFEDQSRVVVESSEIATANTAATQKLADATVVTLSENTELQNERVLAFGDGISGQDANGKITLSVSDVVPKIEGGFVTTFIVVGESHVQLPMTGVLSTVGNRETLLNKTLSAPSVTGISDYADDAAAASGGVAVGGVYRNGSALQVRVA